MAFEFPDLPYDYTALQPHIDAQTMEIHYDRHHRTYFNNFTGAVDGTPNADKSLEAVMATVDAKAAPAIRNNGGGYYNHILYWNSMCDGGSAPSDALASAINDAFGSMDALKGELKQAGIGRFGSGFAWLIVSGGKLAVTSTPNQDNPLMPDYIDGWLEVVDWAKASDRFSAALA